jgi:recombinational DNA repair protein RecR
MALAYDGAIQRLIDAFANLPGIGPKGAQRIAFYLLNAPDEESQRTDRRHQRKSRKKYGSAKSAATCAKPAHARSARIRAATTA